MIAIHSPRAGFATSASLWLPLQPTRPNMPAAAVAAIRVRYRPRRLPTRVDEALAVGAPRVHDRASGSNLSIETAGSWGDPEASASIAERWLSGTWFYPRVTHLCLEPNITVARWDEAAEKLELWTSTHAPYFIVKEVANALGLETDQVVCREVAVGGGFGSKSKISEHEVLAAKLSTATGGRLGWHSAGTKNSPSPRRGTVRG